jgi:hypothetical protein
MSDTALDNLIVSVGKAERGETHVSKDAVHQAMRNIAERMRRDGETTQKAFCRLFVDRDAPGGQVFKAYQGAVGVTHIRKRTMAGNIKPATAPAFPGGSSADHVTNSTWSFDEMVDNLSRSGGMSKGAATLAVMASPAGKVAYMKEKNMRLTRAVGR